MPVAIGAEPARHHLQWEFGAGVRFTYAIFGPFEKRDGGRGTGGFGNGPAQ